MSRTTFYGLLLLAAILIATGTAALHRLLLGLPDTTTLQNYVPPLTSYVYDDSGEVLAEFSIQRRALLPLDKIPVDMQNAVIAVEDDRFFKHWGISPRGILRAALTDILSGHFRQGGSTITQQVSRGIFLTPRKTIARKIREALLSIEIEHEFSKQEILQLYLNQVYFGEGAYGVESAARIYFGKKISDLTLADCALLAGLIQSPRWNSPFLHPVRAAKRRSWVLERMLEQHMITGQEMNEAQSEPLPSVKPLGFATQAPDFAEYVRQKIERKYGYNALWRGGLKVYTTLDLKDQKVAEQAMEQGLSRFDEAALKRWQKKLVEKAKNPYSVDVSTTPPPKVQGAFILMDVKTGAVRAMVGGRDSLFNRATQARRQPGSTFKPFVWAAALKSGLTQADLVDDSPMAYYYDGRDWRLMQGTTEQFITSLATQPFAQNPDFKIWMPTDFDSKYMGLITLREALAESRNIASVRLIERVGPPAVVDLAHKLGIKSRLDPVLSLGLGTSIVSPLEMANAFGTFANGGIHETPYSIERVEDHNGQELQTHLPSERAAISPQLAYLMTDMLKAVVRSGTGRYARRLRRPVAGKTGTTNNNRDLWFIGYTPDYVAAAWMGYDDFSSLGRSLSIQGGVTVLPWWTAIMKQVLQDRPKRDFSVPPDIVFEKMDNSTGMLALPTCPRRHVVLAAFLKGTQPKKYCDIDHSLPIQPQLRQELKGEPPQNAVPQPLTPAEMGPATSTSSIEGQEPAEPEGPEPGGDDSGSGQPSFPQ